MNFIYQGLYLAHMIPLPTESLNETVKNIMEYILPYDLTCLYSWTGTTVIDRAGESSKMAFNEMVGIQQIVKFIVNNEGEKQSDEMILRSMSIFMKRSTQRRDRELTKRLRNK